MDSSADAGLQRLNHRKPDGLLTRLFDNKSFLVTLCLLPTVGLLLIFLTYPLGLGLWLSLTDTTIGQPGEFVGFDNFYLFDDRFSGGGLRIRSSTPPWRQWGNSYSAVARHAAEPPPAVQGIRPRHRAVAVDRADRAVLDRLVVDLSPQFSIVSYVVVDVLHLRDTYFDFLGSPWPARWSLIVADIWRGIPFVAITLLAGLQTISPSLYEAALLDGATALRSSAASACRCCCRSCRSR